MQLNDDLAAVVSPLFEALPLDRAMSQLVVRQGGSRELVTLVNDLVRQPALARQPALQAGLWLYIDELDRSHTISQSMDDATGSFWHGIMHRREGDFGNSHYWFRRVGHHPVMSRIEGYEAHRFIDDVEAVHGGCGNANVLIELQRREWKALFEWCAKQ